MRKVFFYHAAWQYPVIKIPGFQARDFYVESVLITSNK